MINNIVFFLKVLYDKIKWIFKKLTKDKKNINLEKTTFNYTKFRSSHDKIVGWRSREKDLSGTVLPNPKDLPPNWKDTAKRINDWVNKNIEYVTDEENWGEGDYWPTSAEVKDTRKEDCDGQSILKWRMLINDGIPHDKIALIVITGHMFTAVYEDENDFWILDNGSLTYSIQKASDVLPYTDKELKYGFNLYEEWSYK